MFRNLIVLGLMLSSCVSLAAAGDEAMLFENSILPENVGLLISTDSYKRKREIVATSPIPSRTPEKPLSYWFKLLGNSDPKICQEAIEALSEHSETSLLVRPQMPGKWYPEGFANQKRIRNDLRPLVPHLIGLLDRPDTVTCRLAIDALTCIGPDAAAARPALLRIIRSRRHLDEHWLPAVLALFYVTPPNTPVVPELWCVMGQIPDLRGPSETRTIDEQNISDSFSGAFGAVICVRVLVETSRTTIEIPALAQVAQSPAVPRAFRLMILETFTSLKTDARAAIPAVTALLNDNDPLIRITAAGFLISLQEDPEKAFAIVRSLKLEDQIRVKFENGIKEMLEEKARSKEIWKDTTTHDPGTTDWFDRYLLDLATQDEIPFSQREAIRLLGETGPQAKFAIPVLQTALRSPEEYTREAALVALKQIDPSAVPPLLSPSLPSDCTRLLINQAGRRRSVATRPHVQRRHSGSCRRLRRRY